jgi:hypothetical protein
VDVYLDDNGCIIYRPLHIWRLGVTSTFVPYKASISVSHDSI